MTYFALLLFLLSSIFSQTTPEFGLQNTFKQSIAFINATIVNSDGKTIKNGTLLIDGEKITSYGKKRTVSKHYKVIDLKGKFIYPGFIDAYTNYGLQKPEKKKKLAYSSI